MKARNFILPFAMLFFALFFGCKKDTFIEVSGVCPEVILTSPVDGATSVVLNKIITATFNEVMNAATITQASFIVMQGTALKETATTPVLGIVTYTGTTASFTPSSPLTPNTNYYGTIITTVKDLNGNALQEDYEWAFSTSTIPAVTSVIPLNLATNVLLNQAISFIFSEPMDAATITAASTFTLKQGTNLIAGSVLYSGTTGTFTPSSNLLPNTLYTATISTAAKNLAGNAIPSNYVWTFTTSTIPTVISNDPVDLATNVALNKVISATFSEAMNAATITAASTFTLKQGANLVAGSVSYVGVKASFDPNSDLLANTTYTATISIAAKNLAGTSLESDYVWTFTTGTLTAPTVISTDPINLAIGVALNKVITADFSEAMNAATITAASTFTLKQGINLIAGSVSYSGVKASFTPDSDLLAGTEYTATISTDAQNLAGTAMVSDYVWTFTTVIPPPIGLFFGVFGGNAGITNQGLYTVVNGRIGTTAASTLVTGFTDGTNADVYTVTPLNNGLVTDGIYTAAPPPGNATNAAIALEGLNAATDLYLSISPALMPGGAVNPGAGELGGLTLAPGIYVASSSFDITNGDLTLDAQGDPDAKWYFQAPSTLTVGDSQASSVVFLSGVGNPNNVYWYVGSTAVINYAGGGVMVGNIIANSGVTLSSPANSTNASVTTLNGRAISLVSSVTMVNTVINVPTN